MKRYLTILLLLNVVAMTASAREVFPINEGWRFFFKSEKTSDNARHVTLPHSWNTDPLAQGYWLETTGSYQNGMYIPVEWASKRLFVKFYGVQSVADLFVNGYHVGTHRGGATAFTFEITDKIRFGSDNSMLVVVSNSSRDDVLPTSTDMNLYGGIYREAELILTERTAISPLYLGSDGVLVHPQTVGPEKVEGEIEVHITSKGDNSCTLNVDITSPRGERVFSKRQKARLDGKPVSVAFSVDNPTLWSLRDPALYTVTASIGEDSITDRVAVRTGFRSIGASTAEGLTINGERTPVRGVTLYHDNALSGGTLTPEDYDADLRIIRTMGANALRSAVMPHAQYLYDRCDEQGMLVWIDAPLHRSSFLGDVSYFATPAFEQNGLDQLQEIVAQNINHPSVVMWGIFSRLWMRGDDVTPYIRRLNETARTMDPSRPTVACSDQNGDINFITDLIVWQQDVGWRRDRRRDRMARPAAKKLVPPAFGRLLRRQRIPRTQELHGAVRASFELDARGEADAFPRGVCQKPAKRLAVLGRVDRQHVRLRLLAPSLRDQRRRPRDAQPPREKGRLLSVQGDVERRRADAAYRRQTAASARL